MTSDFSLLKNLQQQLTDLDKKQLRRQRRVTETPCAPAMQVDGRQLLAFCSNDYLGLASHPEIIAALKEGADLYGAGSGASHLISGHSIAHHQLEEQLATLFVDNFDQAGCLYFSTGYMANLAVLSALAGKEAEIFSEELNHASLIDGARLSRSKISVYPHRDLTQLESLLQQSQANIKCVVTDSVFSMEGEIAPLPELLTLCERYGAWLVVDDAHGFGVLGEHGHGVLEHFNLHSPHIVYIGTLGKAAGVSGAFVAAHHSVIEWLIQRARTYIYTTATPPAIAHALLKSLAIITGEEGKKLRSHLQSLIAAWRSAQKLQQWKSLASPTAIQPVVIGSNEKVMAVGAALLQQGLWVGAIRPPTVPLNTARLRITLSAAHTLEQLTTLITAIHDCEASMA
jgi:8-amino-7-oxononanoate synthase